MLRFDGTGFARAALAVLLLCVVCGLAGAGCGDGFECGEQSCSDFGGSASRKFTSCYSSGSGSSNDEFVLRDENGQQFYSCSRPADDETMCGVELISAKEAHCAGASSGSGTGGANGSGGGGANGSGGSGGLP